MDEKKIDMAFILNLLHAKGINQPVYGWVVRGGILKIALYGGREVEYPLDVAEQTGAADAAGAAAGVEPVRVVKGKKK